ncbi:hypothetical protein H2200_011155 [Cladophialophora chaetospira]|uniref:Uncharacterized protein n=1 Tax=Cladophialophora chaetospira TaxID=386627 RepID=A0AA38X031_9EURO|nr:hypothetical protein H2200_011155 [Cladophialophora chaetospira]
MDNFFNYPNYQQGPQYMYSTQYLSQAQFEEERDALRSAKEVKDPGVWVIDLDKYYPTHIVTKEGMTFMDENYEWAINLPVWVPKDKDIASQERRLEWIDTNTSAQPKPRGNVSIPYISSNVPLRNVQQKTREYPDLEISFIAGHVLERDLELRREEVPYPEGGRGGPTGREYYYRWVDKQGDVRMHAHYRFNITSYGTQGWLVHTPNKKDLAGSRVTEER